MQIKPIKTPVDHQAALAEILKGHPLKKLGVQFSGISSKGRVFFFACVLELSSLKKELL